jgi:hypothetical protein
MLDSAMYRIISFSSMLFRKTRTHFTGASNRHNDHHSQSHNSLSVYKPTSSLKVATTDETRMPFTSGLKKRGKKNSRTEFAEFDRTAAVGMGREEGRPVGL